MSKGRQIQNEDQQSEFVSCFVVELTPGLSVLQDAWAFRGRLVQGERISL